MSLALLSVVRALSASTGSGSVMSRTHLSSVALLDSMAYRYGTGLAARTFATRTGRAEDETAGSGNTVEMKEMSVAEATRRSKAAVSKARLAQRMANAAATGGSTSASHGSGIDDLRPQDVTVLRHLPPAKTVLGRSLLDLAAGTLPVEPSRRKLAEKAYELATAGGAAGTKAAGAAGAAAGAGEAAAEGVGLADSRARIWAAASASASASASGSASAGVGDASSAVVIASRTPSPTAAASALRRLPTSGFATESDSIAASVARVVSSHSDLRLSGHEGGEGGAAPAAGSLMGVPIPSASKRELLPVGSSRHVTDAEAAEADEMAVGIARHVAVDAAARQPFDTVSRVIREKLQDLPLDRDAFFAAMGASAGERVSPKVWSRYLKVVAAKGHAAHAVAAWREMKSRGVALNESVFVAFISALAKPAPRADDPVLIEDLRSNPPDVAKALVYPAGGVDDVKICVSAPLPPSSERPRGGPEGVVSVAPRFAEYGALRMGYRPAVEVAFKAFEEARALGITPTVPMYSALIRVCAEQQHVERAFAVYGAMRREGLVPDNIIATHLMM